MPKVSVRPLINTRIVWDGKKAIYQALAYPGDDGPDEWITVPLTVFRDVQKQVQTDALTDLSIAISSARDAIDEVIVEYKESQGKSGMLERDN